jgi:hypothetical protein
MRHQRGFTRFTRPVFPSPVAPGWNGRPWAPLLSFEPRRLNTDGARQDGDRPLSTGLKLRSRHQPILRQVAHSKRATSCRTCCFTVTHLPPRRLLPQKPLSGLCARTGLLAASWSGCRTRTIACGRDFIQQRPRALGTRRAAFRRVFSEQRGVQLADETEFVADLRERYRELVLHHREANRVPAP